MYIPKIPLQNFHIKLFEIHQPSKRLIHIHYLIVKLNNLIKTKIQLAHGMNK